jgi:hypothetical protein
LLTVNPDRDVVERMLADGLLRCPECGGVLLPWGRVPRRYVRHADGVEVKVSLRRTICSSRHEDGRRRTHVLLPAYLLGRRLDVAGAIWVVLVARVVDGSGWRRLAALTGRVVSTVRGWVARAGLRAPMIRARFIQAEHLLVSAHGADMARVAPAGSRLGDALAQVGVCLAALRRCGRVTSVGRAVSVLTGGWLLGTRALRPLLDGSNISAHL